MGDNNYRTEIFGQKVFQPGNGINVQVVGRLVHEDDVRISEQRLSQENFHLFITGQISHLLIEQVFGKSQALNQLRGIGFRFPSVQFCKFGFQLRSQNAVFL